MKVENDTNDPVDYDQAGSGGSDDEELPSAQANEEGHLDPDGGNSSFSPAGSAPWTVTFRDDDTGATCTSPPFSDPNATVKIVSFNPCNIEVS